MIPDVYVALVEVAPLPGCELDPAEIRGAAVRCYAPAVSADEAIERVQACLSEDAFRLVGVEWCVANDSVEWENPDDPTANALIEEARATGTVVYGEFHTWGRDASDCD